MLPVQADYIINTEVLTGGAAESLVIGQILELRLTH